MITQDEFRMQQQRIKDGLYPHRIFRLDEISQIEGNVFSLNGLDITMNPLAQKKLNKHMGITQRQLDVVSDFSGEIGKSNFRNYLSAAHNMRNTHNVVVMANPNSKEITDVEILTKDFISIDEFFDFTELFINETNSEIDRILHSKNGDMDVTIYMRNTQPNIVSFAPDESFETNGTRLHWNGASIEVANYFIRLICTNGQTEKIYNKEAKIFSLDTESVMNILKTAKSEKLLSAGFARFKNNAQQALQAHASMSELSYVQKQLASDAINLPTEIINTIIPYDENKNYFENKGVDINLMDTIIKTNVTIWQIYNNLTAFATHTDFWDENAIQRRNIYDLATILLRKKPDIKNYIEYV